MSQRGAVIATLRYLGARQRSHAALRHQGYTGRMPPLLTVGHGQLDHDGLRDLLLGADVDVVVDVRRFRGSRRNPDVNQGSLQQWLPEAGIDYTWEDGLGGRRSLPTEAGTQDPWWTVDAFRAYAAHSRTPEFTEALERVLDTATRRTVAVMCSESVWWRCHRRLIADVCTVARDLDVRHLMPDGRLREHRPAAGARRRDDGLLVWDRHQ